MNRSHDKRPIVYAIRDFPSGCGTPTNVPDKDFKYPRTSDADHVVTDSQPIVVSHEEKEQEFRSSKRDRVLVEAPKPEETCLKRELAFRNSNRDLVLAAPKDKGSCSRQEREFKNSDYDHVLAAPTPREKVLEVLRRFKDVYRELDRNKQARRGGDSFDATARIDLKTLAFLESEGKQVNTQNRIGQVPGIQVGDVFQYKTELRLVGLHYKNMCGIDYMKIGGVKFATSIVSSEGCGYSDTFDGDVMTYTGEGGNMISKEKETEDQKMIKGNLALVNSMRHKTEVRVIRGSKRWDGKGKRYVYDGLYLGDRYWLEKGVSGKNIYKFKLCRIPGQPR